MHDLAQFYGLEIPPEPMSVNDAIAAGIIQPQRLSPKAGFFVREWLIIRDERGRPIPVDAEDIYWSSWEMWRLHRIVQYLGGTSPVQFRAIPTGFREPMVDLSAGATDMEFEAAKGFLIDQGIANHPREAWNRYDRPKGN